MNKTEFIDAIAKEANVTKVEARKTVDAFVSVVGKTLKKGDKITLVGFGTFSVLSKPARKGRNPRTKEVITIPAKKVAKFKPGSELNELVK